MDINELRTAVTLISMVMFLAIVAWVYSKKRDQRSFDELAALPLIDDAAPLAASANGSQGGPNE